MKKYFVSLSLLALIVVACGGGRASVVDNITDNLIVEKLPNEGEKRNDIKIDLKYDKSFRQGQNIILDCTINAHVDSVKLIMRNEEMNIPLVNGCWVIPTSSETKVGTVNFKITAFKGTSFVMRVGSFLITPSAEVKKYKARALKIYPHSKNAFTQGLEFYNGILYESSGEYGKSFVHALEFPSMKVKNSYNLDAKLFAEGLTFIGDKMYLLTWQEYKCFVFDPKTLKPTHEFQYNTEGWGITTDKKYLYMSDGTQYIYIVDPVTFKQIDKLEVMLGNKPLMEINELEWIEGEIWANIFTTDNIARINPRTGAVVGMIDASGLLLSKDYTKDTNVLNGIAYDAEQKKIYLTGKNWPKLFEVVVRSE